MFRLKKRPNIETSQELRQQIRWKLNRKLRGHKRLTTVDRCRPAKKPRRRKNLNKIINENCTNTSLMFLTVQKRPKLFQSSKTRQKSLTTLTLALGLFIAATISILLLIPQTSRASLIIGDSAIEIQEVDQGDTVSRPNEGSQQHISNNGITQADGPASFVNDASGGNGKGDQTNINTAQQNNEQFESAQPIPTSQSSRSSSSNVTPPLPPYAGSSGRADSGSSMGSSEDGSLLERPSLSGVQKSDASSRTVSGKVVDFELTPAGGHNKAKIKKKKKKKKKEMKKEAKEEKKFKKWNKKKKSEKKEMEKKHQHSEKKKKEEAKKSKKKWGLDVHGQKKKGKFKKAKWGKKEKKGKGIKKGKKGKKFLKDKGHKSTGFKNVYHKEEYGGSHKWHDIKREKKWDEKSKKWKKKWKKLKGKKYKGEHMKKFEKKKKEGKKYKKEKMEKFKKSKKEKMEKGMKKKMEEHAKKKESGKKKEMKEKKEMKKKKKKKG